MTIHLSPSEKDIFRIVQAIRQLIQGHDDSSGVVTLTANATTTTVAAPNVAPTSNILLSPATADAAGEWQNGTIYVKQSDVIQGQFKITHANAASVDRTVFWCARG